MSRLPEIDLAVQSAKWPSGIAWRDILGQAVSEVWAATEQKRQKTEVSFVLSEDDAVRKLNASYRGQDKATNVLSFPSGDVPINSEAPLLLGDIVFAIETVKREAGQQQKSLEGHFAHLAVHGLLHLLGYDHTSDEEADVMETLEVSILDQMGIPNPYNYQPTAAE